MKRFALAFSLLCVLSGTTLAGLIPSTDVTAPVPPPQESEGSIPTGDLTNPVFETILTVIGIAV